MDFGHILMPDGRCAPVLLSTYWQLCVDTSIVSTMKPVSPMLASTIRCSLRAAARLHAVPLLPQLTRAVELQPGAVDPRVRWTIRQQREADAA
jgi:hypothetical protein